MKNKKGFTIVELVIVIAVIAILAAVLIPTFSGVVSKANDSSALQTAQNTLKQALLMTNTATISEGSLIVLDTDKEASSRPNYVYRYGNDTLDAKTDVYENSSSTSFKSGTLAEGTNAIFCSSTAVTKNDGETPTYTLDSLTLSIIKAATAYTTASASLEYVKDGQYKITLQAAGENVEAVVWSLYTSTDMSGKNVVVLTKIG